jgi:hypothetical protein
MLFPGLCLPISILIVRRQVVDIQVNGSSCHRAAARFTLPIHGHSLASGVLHPTAVICYTLARAAESALLNNSLVKDGSPVRALVCE